MLTIHNVAGINILNDLWIQVINILIRTLGYNFMNVFSFILQIL